MSARIVSRVAGLSCAVGAEIGLANLPAYVLIVAGILVLATIIVIVYALVRRSVVRSLGRLADDAAAMAAGTLNHTGRDDRRDEIGRLAEALNRMNDKFGKRVAELGRTATARSSELTRRNAQLRAVSLVAQEAAQERDVTSLLTTAVNAISEHFGYYHAAVFIVDDAGEWAVLRSASSEGGKRMLSRGHRLRVGQVGIVGYVAARGRSRIASVVDDDVVWYDNPDLPQTRSEVALPLLARPSSRPRPADTEQQPDARDYSDARQYSDAAPHVIGVLDVQSVEERAFMQSDVATLQLVADQLAAALANAEVNEAMASALAELRDLQVDYGRKGWARVARRMRPMAYEYDRAATMPVPLLPVPDDLAEGRISSGVVQDGGVPTYLEALRVGDRTLGYLGLSDPNRVWSEEELSLVRSVGEQVALALENARLFEDTQRSERQQYLISRILQVAAQKAEHRSVTTTETRGDTPADVEQRGDDEVMEILREIARVLAQGLNMAVVIFTFPILGRPIVRSHAVVDPDGKRLRLFEEDLTLSPEHFSFFHGLEGPELGPMAPLLERSIFADSEALQRFDVDRVLYVPIAQVAQNGALAESQDGTSRKGAGGRGFIAFVQSLDEPPIDPSTRDLTQNLANQVAVVLENLNLSEETRQRSEELSELYRISLELAEILEPGEVLARLMVRGADLLGADAADTWVYDAEAGTLMFGMSSTRGGPGPAAGGRPAQAGRDLADEALSQQQAVFVEEAAGEFRSLMAIPLIGRLGPLGVLVVMSEAMGAFGPRDAGLASLFSAQAAAALENAQLNREAQRRAEEFAQLYDAGIDLITILDVEDLLTRSADWARRVFDAERAVVFLRSPDGAAGRYLRGQSASEGRYLFDREIDQPDADGVTARIVRMNESMLIGDSRQMQLPSAARLVEAGLLSQMGTPLRVGDQVIGALFVNGAEVDRFDDHDLDLLEFLSTQISSAMQNALQFGRTQRALALVGRQARYQTNVSQAVALLNERGTDAVPDVLRLVGEAAGPQEVRYYVAGLGDLTDGDTDAVWRLASAWTAGESDAKSPAFSQTHLLPVGEFPHWRSALEAEGYALTDEIGESASIPFDAVRCLGLAVPSEDACPGFLALLTDDEEPWQQQDIVALQTVAAALSNTSARESLFRQVEATLSETDALYRASSALSEAGTYDAILETLLAHTVLGEGAQRATLELFDQPWADANGSQATGDGMAWVGGTPQDSEIVAYWPMKPGVEVRTRYAGRKFRALLRALEAGTPIFIEDLGRVAMDRARADDGHVLADGPAGPDTLALDRRVLALFRRALGAESAIFVPLAVGGQKIGFLHADYASPQTFSEAARRRLVSLAQQASVAVLNLRQLRQTEARVRREQLIRRITGQIQEAPDVEGVLRTAVRELGRAFGTPRSEIVFHPPATGPAESELPGRGYDGHGADTSEPEATSAGATAGAERRSAAP